jgi:hypothetical protein
MLVQKNRNWAQCLNCGEQFELGQLPETTSEAKSSEPELVMS